MKKIFEFIQEELENAFEAAGYDRGLGKVTLSNRPDLCEYQCNGAMAGAKTYRKAPIMIANDVVEKLQESTCIQEAEAVAPGFINLKLDREFLAGYLNQMSEDAHLGFETAKEPKTIIVDYGGANVAKPLHVGHLRSAIIGESIKRIGKFAGHHVIGDVHLGDWGYQMGLVITELKKRKPELPYFDENFAGNIRKKLRLQSGSWKKSIRLQVLMQKNMKTIKKKRFKRLFCYRTDTVAIVQCGNIS